jgi:flagellar biosynthesis anti-sigma factor FlgM
MKVGGIKGGASGASKAKGPAKSGTGSKVEKRAPVLGALGAPVADKVEVVDHAATIEMIKDLVADSPDVRVDEVERVIGQLKSGKYKIDFAKVAEGFIKEVILTEIARKPRKK